MGAGSGGSYLYRLLRQRRPDLDISLYDRPTPNPCGIKGCAWGLSRPFFFQLSAEAGLDPSRYVLGTYDHVVINGQCLKADLIIINKPAFIKDVLNGAEMRDPDTAQIDAFDRVIDATGYERAYLPPVEALPIVSAVQVRLKAKAPRAPTAVFNPRGGYSWLFPAGDGEVHLGCFRRWDSMSPGKNSRR